MYRVSHKNDPLCFFCHNFYNQWHFFSQILHTHVINKDCKLEANSTFKTQWLKMFNKVLRLLSNLKLNRLNKEPLSNQNSPAIQLQNVRFDLFFILKCQLATSVVIMKRKICNI